MRHRERKKQRGASGSQLGDGQEGRGREVRSSGSGSAPEPGAGALLFRVLKTTGGNLSNCWAVECRVKSRKYARGETARC